MAGTAEPHAGSDRFWADSIPPGAAAQLQRNMGPTMSPLNGVLISTPNATFEVSLSGLVAGAYRFHCLPHLALGMTGQIVVQR